MNTPKTIKLWIVANEAAFYQCGNEKRKNLVGNPKVTRAKDSATGLYLLIALAALQKEGDSLEILKQHSVTTDQVNDRLKNVIDKLGRDKIETTGWVFFFFSDHPIRAFLNGHNDETPLKVSFHPAVQVSIIDAISGENLGEDKIVAFIKRLLELGDPETIHLELRVWDVNGHSRKIDNKTSIGILRAKESVRIRISANYPTYICCFWIDPGGRLLKLHPEIEKEDGFSEYRAKFEKLDSGHRILTIPCNNTFDVSSTIGMSNLISLAYPRNFDSDQIAEIRIRLETLIANFTFHTSSAKWNSFEKPLDEALRPRIKPTRQPYGLLPKTQPSTWQESIVDQMHGLATKISVLYIPQNPQ